MPPAEPPEKQPGARERILRTAGPLFYREGFRAVGVDRVIAEAGVAKATFYKHFPSKDDLIVAWVERAEGLSDSAFSGAAGDEPMTAYAETVIALAEEDTCMGCTFQGTAAEFADPAHPGHAAALAVKRRVLAELERRATLQGLARPKAAAERVFLFLEGVWAAVRMFGSEAPLGEAREAVRRLIRD
jgi:AcrR family transcriptional regulator